MTASNESGQRDASETRPREIASACVSTRRWHLNLYVRRTGAPGGLWLGQEHLQVIALGLDLAASWGRRP